MLLLQVLLGWELTSSSSSVWMSLLLARRLVQQMTHLT